VIVCIGVCKCLQCLRAMCVYVYTFLHLGMDDEEKFPKPASQQEQDDYDRRVLEIALEKGISFSRMKKRYSFFSVERRNFYRRMAVKCTDPRPSRGGSRIGSGAKRKGDIDGAPRKLYMDRENKRKQTDDRRFVYTDDYRAYVFTPAIVDVTQQVSQLEVDMRQMLKCVESCFKDQPDDEYGKDTSFVCDLGVGDSTGQRRRVLFPSVKQRTSEQLHGTAKKGNLDKLFIDKTFVKSRPGFERFTEDVVKLSKICETAVRNKVMKEGLSLEPGYPMLHETECMMTPIGAEKQDAHADTRFNIVSAFINLCICPGNSTWSATKESFTSSKSGQHMNTLNYVQVPLAEDKVEVYINHSAWPHHGPGNKSDQVRYVLFFAFALDERAMRHTTSEEVLRFV
jgi:hypothetical protein